MGKKLQTDRKNLFKPTLPCFTKSVRKWRFGNGNRRKKKKSKNIFELDGENFIWRQFFEDKNIYGRWGEFPLEKKAKDEIFGKVFDAILKELHKKENSISLLQNLNESLLKEKNELAQMAENCASVKENFERKIFRKFSVLLNSKKKKNLELRAQIQEFTKQERIAPSTSFADIANKNGKVSMDNSDDEEKDDYELEVDTDIETFEGEVSSSTIWKRKGSGSTSDSEVKKLKDKREEILQDSFSRNLPSNSLEEELAVASFSGHNIKKKF